MKYQYVHNVLPNLDKYRLDYKINFIKKQTKQKATYNRYRQELTMHFRITCEVEEEENNKKI